MKEIFTESFDRVIEAKHDVFYDFEISKDATGSIVLLLENGCTNIHVSIRQQEYSSLSLFIQNRDERDLNLKTEFHLEKDAACKCGILDLEKGSLNFALDGTLASQGASLEVYTGMLASSDSRKVSDMKITHKAGHTYGNMHNFAVQKSKSYFEMVASGRIDKGCQEAQSHQETRVLTLAEDARNKVIPILYIDENDVKASHALSIGQPDAEQMYYLQSRGLSYQSALGLLSVGYFMPVIETASSEERREELKAEMESKVGLHGYN